MTGRLKRETELLRRGVRLVFRFLKENRKMGRLDGQDRRKGAPGCLNLKSNGTSDVSVPVWPADIAPSGKRRRCTIHLSFTKASNFQLFHGQSLPQTSNKVGTSTAAQATTTKLKRPS